ncbi:MAG: hypothetical protein ABIQ40_02095 [Bacteroidia bacterium]
MKKNLPIAFSLFIICFLIFSFSKDKSKEKKITAKEMGDSIRSRLASEPFEKNLNLPNIPTGYKLPPDALNGAPYIVGCLVNIDSAGNITYVLGINCAIQERITTQLLSTAPDFDTYVGSGVNTNIQAVKNITTNLGAERSVHVSYQTFFSANSKGNFIDMEALKKAFEEHDMTEYKNLQIVQSVIVKRLTYTTFTKFEGQATGSTMLVNVNGGLYCRSGTETNIYDMYISTTKIPPFIKKQPVSIIKSEPDIKPIPKMIGVLEIISSDTVKIDDIKPN